MSFLLRRAASAAARERQCVFMCGVPGSGKTRIIRSRFGPGSPCSSALVIDLDLEMRHHPEFDESNPASIYDDPAAYAWADKRVERHFQAALHDEQLSGIVVDGTGCACAAARGRACARHRRP